MGDKILLVDDDEDLVESLGDSLELRGYSVLLATSGKRGIELYSKNHPCIVFMDVKMPEMDGYEAFSNIKKIDKLAKILLVTGHEIKNKTHDAILIGLLGVMIKPINIQKYIDVIKKYNC